MKRTLIIAEAGVNHNGDLEIAKQLIDAAADAGVDYVKFQTFKTENLVSKHAPKAQYQLDNTIDKSESQFDMIKKLELDLNTHILLRDYCAEKGVQFLSTAFDLDSIDLLNQIGIDFFKLPSGELTNRPYLHKIGSQSLPIIMSTGMATMDEIAEALEVLYEAGASKESITILHCNTEYPTPMADVNLLAMKSIEEEFGIRTGYSDHTLGIEIPIAATALGAVCIEKHFTLDRNMDGPDHKASLEPKELKQMVSAIRNIERAMGDGIKQPSSSELDNIPIARKSIHLSKEIQSGESITNDHLVAMRPGDGISPMEWNELIDKQVNKTLPAGHKLKLSDLT